MRILGGELGGRVFQVPMKSWPTRPTTDIAKEALYNILTNRIDFENVSFLDLFGGTGAHTLEFLSRGCSDVTYVDNYAKCVSWLKKLFEELGYLEKCDIRKQNVRRFIQSSERTFDIIFADPPYALPWLPDLPDMVVMKELLSERGIFILEHGAEHSFSDHEKFTEVRSYGQSRFSFFKMGE